MNRWIENLPGPKLKSVVDLHGAALMERHHTDDVYFAIWLHAVNNAVKRRVMLGYDDMEDWAYRDAYDAGESPAEAAVNMLNDNGWADALSEEERV